MQCQIKWEEGSIGAMKQESRGTWVRGLCPTGKVLELHPSCPMEMPFLSRGSPFLDTKLKKKSLMCL